MADKKNFSVFIAEDELPAREQLMEYLLEFSELTLSGIAKNGEEALEKLSSGNYDLLLLDIHLPVYSGIEVLEKLENPPRVIFTTAYDKYAIKAFEHGAVDYILKPFTAERFRQAVKKFLASAGSGARTKSIRDIGLSFREEGRICLLPYRDIIYLSSHAKHSVIHTEEREFETPLLLKNLEEKLPDDIFMRIHKRHIVNINYISNLEYYIGGQYIAYLKDREESNLAVGRAFSQELKKRLNA